MAVRNGTLLVVHAVAAAVALQTSPGLAQAQLTASHSPDQELNLTLSGGIGRWHRLEVSTNLLSWTCLTSFYQSNSTCTHVESTSTNSAKFYRARDLTTALDRYVSAPDTNYSYRLANTIPGTGQTTYVLDMTSQSWLTTSEVDRVLWKHWVIIVVPTGATNNHALLFISGGSNPGTIPSGADNNLRQIATDTKTVVAELKMVPNQPLRFAGETFTRSEDSMIAYTWDKYLRTGDERWPARLPMTKAAVRAMDSMTSFCATNPAGALNVNRFIVSGASKRGWTTWTTAVVDRRVVGIVPLVIDLLNVEPSMLHHYAAYGTWSPAIYDYEAMGIMNWLGTPEFRRLMQIEDPYEYRERLTLPKFIINATGDEFFLPDSSQFYFDDLSGTKYLRYVPNTSHSLSGTDVYVTLEGCYQSLMFGTTLPQFTWSLETSNQVRVLTRDLPQTATLWQATNATARDFRLQVIGAAWQGTTLPYLGGGLYVGRVDNPATGWKAFFVELTYLRTGQATLKFTTPVFVVPNTLLYHFPP